MKRMASINPEQLVRHLVSLSREIVLGQQSEDDQFHAPKKARDWRSKLSGGFQSDQ
jgi:hypothetical protein